MTEPNTLLRGHKGENFLETGMWLLNGDDEPTYIPPRPESAVDRLANIVREEDDAND